MKKHGLCFNGFREFACKAAMLLSLSCLAMALKGQTIDLVNVTCTGNGTATATILCPPDPPLIVPRSHASIPWAQGITIRGEYYDYLAQLYYQARASNNCGTERSSNSVRLAVQGDNSITLKIDWMNRARDYSLLEGGTGSAIADNHFDFRIKFMVSPGGGLNNGDPVTVYYKVSMYGAGLTSHETGLMEDPVSETDSLWLGTQLLSLNKFNFQDPPIPGSGNDIDRLYLINSFLAIVGVPDSVTFKSDQSATISSPGVPDARGMRDQATCNVKGHIDLSLNPQVFPDYALAGIEFCTDIGSDADGSDPRANGNEVFDPGDTYLLGGPLLALPQNGIRNDASMFFGTDPYPVPGDLTSNVPCGSGVFTPSNYFEVDDFDFLQTNLLNYSYGPGWSSVEPFPDALLLEADYLLISYDDDWAENWSMNISGYIPVPDSSGSTFLNDRFGQTMRADEVIALDADARQAPSSPFSNDSLWNEVMVHPNFYPNPENREADDDDLNGLKFFPDHTLDGFFYFSADNEAIYRDGMGSPLNPGSIYLSGPTGPVEVVNPVMHLGLAAGTDINAFAFGWVYDTIPERMGLALLFSVDADDWTTPADESGGLDPAMIYYSFLNGSNSPFIDEPMAENIDALTIVPESFNGRPWDLPAGKDFGDAPDPGYPTLEAGDGARHLNDQITFLGTLIDAEPDGQPAADAKGDDVTNLDDEDGVNILWPIAAGHPCKLDVTASVGDGLFNGWFDFNGNHSWGDPGEQVFTDLTLFPGTNRLTFITPVTALPGFSYTRFRFSHQPALSFTGQAFDGEVEDYTFSGQFFDQVKWQQSPDLGFPGLHAADAVVLADDWVCAGDSVAGISWWGNYELLPGGIENRGLGISHFVVEVFSDMACLPGTSLISYTVPFMASMEMPTNLFNSEGSPVYRYDFMLSDPFDQEKGSTYWLSIHAFSNDIANPAMWRWQEANRGHWPVHCGAAQLAGTDWQTIEWLVPSPVRYSDLAFLLKTVMPDSLWLPNIIVAGGENSCYDAYDVVVVAGSGTTFKVLSGGRATMVAGQMIRYLDGATVMDGGYMHGYITTNGQFCPAVKEAPFIMAFPGTEERPAPAEMNQNCSIRVYPNPTTGILTLAVTGMPGPVSVEIFSIMGEKVYSGTCSSPGMHEISLESQPVGVYLLRIVSGAGSQTLHVIKH